MADAPGQVTSPAPRGAVPALLLGFLAQNTTVALTFGLYGVFIRFFAESFALDRTMASAGLPIVILTMLCERFSIAIAEEGMRNALARMGYSLLVVAAVYPIMRDPRAEHLMFSFPELTLVVMGLLVWIGGYTGYRLMDLLRFRSFADRAEGTA